MEIFTKSAQDLFEKKVTKDTVKPTPTRYTFRTGKPPVVKDAAELSRINARQNG